ncbi:TPA: exo-alpha-sialidase [Acinetobacter baumannii]
MTVPISDRLSQLYVGNGTNTRFDFTFRVFEQEDATGIAVRKKGSTDFETVDPSTYTVTVNPDHMGGYITFNSPPSAGTYFYIAGETPLDQLLDITNYDNFYPEAIEAALDKITSMLQERSTQLDLEKQARILADIHYDALAMEREENLENRIISYINAVIGITNPKIFDGITDRMVITEDGRTQREFNQSIPFWTNDYVAFKQETIQRENKIVEHADAQLSAVNSQLSNAINAETQRAITVENWQQEQINSLGVGNKAYKTYAAMDADKANIPINSKVTVTNDPDPTKNHDWQWDGSTFTASAYDPIKQAAQYTDKKTQDVIDENIPQYNSKKNIHTWLSQDKVVMNLDAQGVLNVEDIHTQSQYSESGPKLAHNFTDKNGLTLLGVYPDGTIDFTKKLEEKYLSQQSYMQFVELDKLKNQNTTPYFFETVVAPFQADNKLHQRMAATIQVASNKLFVVFAQFNTANTDAVNARLVGRFVTFDLIAKTINVDQNTIIMRDTGNSAIASRHPNIIKLKDGRFMCLYNETLVAGSSKSPLYAIYSNDCVTWSEPVLKLIDNNDNFAFTAPVTIQRIHTGKYKDRLIFPIYNSSFQVRFVYSDDEGETWQAGSIWSGADFGDSTLQTNETNVVIDIDGSVIAHCRTDKNSDSNRYLYVVKSSDGGKTVDFIGKNLNFLASNCAVGMVQSAQKFGDGVPKILVSRPTSLTHFSRNRFTISASYDGLRTSQYDYKPYADDVNVGYTHLLALDDQNFVLTMEKGTEINNGNNFISIAFFNIAEVMKND